MKVYFINSHANDVFYVRAETPEEAEEILRREIAKFVFQKNLKDDEEIVIPETLGKNIIVEFGIRKDILDNDLEVEDITAAAYIFSSNGQPHWEDWDIEISDAVGNESVAKSIEDMIDATEKEIKAAVSNV